MKEHHSSCEIYAENGTVISRFFDPQTGDLVMEVHLDPEMARDYAFHLTSASIKAEEEQK